MTIKIELAENGFIITEADNTKYVYTSEEDLMKQEFSYLFQELYENDGQLTVTIKTDAEEI